MILRKKKKYFTIQYLVVRYYYLDGNSVNEYNN